MLEWTDAERNERMVNPCDSESLDAFIGVSRDRYTIFMGMSLHKGYLNRAARVGEILAQNY